MNSFRGVALGTLEDQVRDPLNSRSENSCSSAIALASPFAALHNWGLFWEVSPKVPGPSRPLAGRVSFDSRVRPLP